MKDLLKKIAIIITVAVLFSIFVQSLAEVVVEQPKFTDYCREEVKLPSVIRETGNCTELDITDEEEQSCYEKDGVITYEYDTQGCQKNWECNLCRAEYEKAMEGHNKVVFMISAIFGLAAMMFGLFYKKKETFFGKIKSKLFGKGTETFWDWTKSGFLVGGIITLFIGTMRYWDDMSRFLRPVTMLVELIIILLITYRILKKK